MVSQEQVVLLIKEYVFDNLLPEYTFYNVKHKRFQEQSYVLWASEELISYISSRKNGSPIDAVRSFVYKMGRFSKMNPKTKYAFDVAYNLTVNILDICRCAGWLD